MMNAGPETSNFNSTPAETGSAGVEIAPGLSVSSAVLRFSFSGSRGPGGQNVNKRATKAELRVLVSDLPLSAPVAMRLTDLAGRRIIDGGELVITADESRSQGQNKSACLDRLRELLVQAKVKPKIRRATKPSRGSKERRLVEKKSRGKIKARRSGPSHND